MPAKPRDFLDDKVAKAVDAVETKVVQIEMQQVQIKLLGRDDRPAVIIVPKDITDIELLNVVGNVLAIGDQLRAQRPASRIILPNGAIQ